LECAVSAALLDGLEALRKLKAALTCRTPKELRS
jgi:hypothetical protein